MILVVFIELIVAIVCAVCFFTGAWIPSTTFLGFMFIGWILSCIGGICREAKYG